MEWFKPKQEDVLVPCKKCGNKVPSSSLKLDLDIGMMVCADCIKNKKIHKEIEHEVLHKEENVMIKNINHPKMEIVQEPKSNKIAHKCTSCGYKFKIDIETKIPKYCPYCNARVMSF